MSGLTRRNFLGISAGAAVILAVPHEDTPIRRRYLSESEQADGASCLYYYWVRPRQVDDLINNGWHRVGQTLHVPGSQDLDLMATTDVNYKRFVTRHVVQLRDLS